MPVTKTMAIETDEVYFIYGFDSTLRVSRRLEMRLGAFNVFDHAQFNNPDGTCSDPIPPNGTFGEVLSAGPPRLVQLAAKIYF
jgi:hypothetical protein